MRSLNQWLSTELELCQKTTPLDVAYEETKTIYSLLLSGQQGIVLRKKFQNHTGETHHSHNGQGNLDYAIECRSTNRIVGLVEVKKDDFSTGHGADVVP
ncbi:unnamed protein product [Rhizophagus irregularis]|nr:unnamed protein product [Rhizophagus irregularis]